MNNTLRFFLNNISINKDTNVYDNDLLIDFINQHAKSLFGHNVSLSYPEHRTQLSNEIQKTKRTKSVTLNKWVRAAMKIFNLGDLSGQILQLIWDMDKNPTIRTLIYSVTNTSAVEISSKEQFAKLFNVSTDDFDSGAWDLCAHGLVHNIGDLDRLQLSSAGNDILTGKYKTPAQAKELIVGTNQTSLLTAKDFSFIRDDYDFIHDILRGTISNQQSGINILLYGTQGAIKSEIAKSLAQSVGCKTYAIYSNKNCQWLRLRRYQTILEKDDKSIILYDCADNTLTDMSERNKSTFTSNKRPIIWTADDISEIEHEILTKMTYCAKIPEPDISIKKALWQNIAKNQNVTLSNNDINTFCSLPVTEPDAINRAVLCIKLTGRTDSVQKIVSAQNHVLGKNNTSPAPNLTNATFNTDLLNTDTNLINLANKLTSGNIKPNFSLCLYGVSGTGKSAFAKYLADRMGYQILSKRTSDLLSPYIGRTEEAIASAFADAAKDNKILIFDEADSFLQSRENAMRTWEVTAVNEMLTQMEAATTPFICTTNLMDKIDRASLRRFTFKVKYDYMTPDQARTAFLHFFANSLSPDSVLPDNLTPGDFAVVQNRANILGISDTNELINMLADEVKAKNIKKTNTIGF